MNVTTPRMVVEIPDFAGYLAAGQIPRPVADAASEGRRSPGPSEKRDIGLGVTYIRAAQGGFEHMDERIVVSDKSPIKTVAEAFGVHKTTVQGWKKNIPPASPGIHRVDGNVLEFLMRQAGERYQKAGRSVVAILARGRSN